MKKKVAVIIVEYNTPERCISYIEDFRKTCDEKSIGFVVVDNYTVADNSSFFFGFNSDDVVYIRNEQNEGFAKANNIGVEIANKKYDPEFYLFSNTDIRLPEKLEMSKMITKLDQLDCCAVMGPKVTALSLIHI